MDSTMLRQFSWQCSSFSLNSSSSFSFGSPDDSSQYSYFHDLLKLFFHFNLLYLCNLALIQEVIVMSILLPLLFLLLCQLTKGNYISFGKGKDIFLLNLTMFHCSFRKNSIFRAFNHVGAVLSTLMRLFYIL